MLKDFCWSAVVFPPLVGGGVEGGEGGRGGGGGQEKLKVVPRRRSIERCSGN